MESLVANYDELINLLRVKIQACHCVFDRIGEGVKEEFQRRLQEFEQKELERQELVEQYKREGYADAETIFEPQRQKIREMVTNLSRATILIIKKLRHALDALETLASDDEKQRSTYEKLKSNVMLYRKTYMFNQGLAALEKQLAEITQFALTFDGILRDNLVSLGMLVEQISPIDSRLSESLEDIEKLSVELEQGTFTSNLDVVSDRLVSTVITGCMRAEVVEDILLKMANPVQDIQKIDFDLILTQNLTDTLDFKALAENMQILVERGIHDLAMVVDQAIEDLSVRCNKADGIRDYFYIAALGYSDDEIRHIIGTKGQPWVLISTLARSPRELYRDGDGIPHPRWVLPQHSGNTPMRAAFEQACYMVADWCETHPASYPPTVINITDGQPTDGSPEEAAAVLRKLHTNDGETLLFNLHVGDPGDGSTKNVVFPDTSDGLGEYGKLLFRRSSLLPHHLYDTAAAEGFSLSPQARFFAYGAEAKLATRFLNLGTRPGRMI